MDSLPDEGSYIPPDPENFEESGVWICPRNPPETFPEKMNTIPGLLFAVFVGAIFWASLFFLCAKLANN